MTATVRPTSTAEPIAIAAATMKKMSLADTFLPIAARFCLVELLADVGGRGDTRAMRQHSGSYSGRVGTDSPFWVPGEAKREVRERLEEGVTGFTVTCRRESAPLLEVSAGLIARAFAAGD